MIISLLMHLAMVGCARQQSTIASVGDIKQKVAAKVGAMTGTTGEALAISEFPQATVKSFDDIMDAVAAIKSGQLDAIVTAYPTALQVTKKNQELMLLPEPLDHEDTAIAFRKDSTALQQQVNAIIAELKADGTLQAMQKRWLKPDLSPYQEVDIPVPTSGKVLKIGVSATREPLSFVDKNGKVSGHDGELARIIGQKLQRPVEFFNMKFMALIPALQSGKVDMILTGMTATEERKKHVNFSDPYFSNSQVVLVQKPALMSQPSVAGGDEGASQKASAESIEGSGKLSAAADLKTKRIGVLLGSAHDKYATVNFPQAQIMQYNTASDLVLAVKTAKVDAAIFDEAPLQEILRLNADIGLLGDVLFSFPIGVGISKQNEALLKDFNQFLAQIKRDGTYDDMVERWSKLGITKMPAIGSGSTNGTLRATVNDVGLPFVAVMDNQLLGFDIELLKRFAAYQGKALELSNADFSSLVASVASGKADLIASSIFITDERKQQINFSDPYYEMGARFFALKRNIASATPHAGESSSAAKPDTASKWPAFLTNIVQSFESNILHEDRYLLILDGLQVTVTIAVLATILGTLLGGLVCFMRMSAHAWLCVPAKIYISILRGMPVLVLLMLIFYVVFASVNISPVLVAVIAFGMNFAAYVAEIFRAGINGIDKGQAEAGIAMGFTRLNTFIYITLPQTIQRILPVYKGEFISLVKMTSIVGYIAVQDLTKASDIIRSRTFDAFFPLVMIAILYFMISWVLMQLLEYLERRIDPRHKRQL